MVQTECVSDAGQHYVGKPAVRASRAVFLTECQAKTFYGIEADSCQGVPQLPQGCPQRLALVGRAQIAKGKQVENLPGMRFRRGAPPSVAGEA